MRMSIKFLAALSLITLIQTEASAKDQMCKAGDPSDTCVNLRYPANGELVRLLPNRSWIWIDPNRTEHDQKKRPWTAVINQRSRSPEGREFVIKKFVYGYRTGSPYSDWFIQLNTQQGVTHNSS